MNTRRRLPVRVAAVVAVAVLGVSACTSDPSPTRVAQDLVNTEIDDEDVRDCMLAVIDEYDLDALGEDATSDNPDTAAEAQAELDRYQADLEDCR